MNKQKIQTLLHELAEKEFQPQSIDLWPDLKQILVTRNSLYGKQGEIKMNHNNKINRSIQWGLTAGLLVIGFCTFLFATPQGKVLAQNIVEFFTRSESNQKTVPTLAATLQSQPAELIATALPAGSAGSGQAEVCGTMTSPRCTIAEVQALVEFEIQGFQQPPEGMKFMGANTLADGVLMQYLGTENQGLVYLIEQTIQEGHEDTWKIGKDATVERVMVNQLPADYVVGAWSGLGIPDEELTWDDSFTPYSLRWQAAGIQFTLMGFPAKTDTGPLLNREFLLDLAETVGAVSNMEPPIGVADSLDLADAESQAGFDFIESDWIPAGLSLKKTVYNSPHNAICQYYFAPMDDPTFPPLVIAQSNQALPTLDEMQSKMFFDGVQVEIYLEQESIPIHGADEGTGQFISTGIQIDALCGGDPISSNRVLLWEQNGRSFALFTKLNSNVGGSFVSRMEMQRLAQSLNGVSNANQPASPDPERLLSLDEAQSLTDFPIQQPDVMLSNVHFDHMSFGAFFGWPSRVSTYYAGDPTGDGRTYHVLIFQTDKSESSLDELRLAGGFHDVVVKGNPGLYQAQCFDLPFYGNICNQYLTWFEGQTQFDIETFFPAIVPEETILEIAESMK